MKYSYTTQNVCPSAIHFNINDGVVSDIVFVGGCDGNLKALSKLLDGAPADEIEKQFAGILCEHRNTSCAGQLAIAVKQAAQATKTESM